MRLLAGLCLITVILVLAGGRARACDDPPLSDPPAKKSAGSSNNPARQRQQRIEKERDRTEAMLRFLNKPVERIDFDQAPFEKVLAWFKEQGLDNVIVRWKSVETGGIVTRETPINLTLEQMTMGEILDLVLEQASVRATIPEDELTYHIFNGVLRISTRGDFARMIYTRTYYVEDLLYPIAINELLPYLEIGQQFAYVREVDPQVGGGAVGNRPIIEVIDTGVIHGPGDPAYGRPDFKARREEQLKKLIYLLKRVHPQTWRENGGNGSIQAFGDKLVISQNIEMHEIIGGCFRQQARSSK